MSSKLGWRVLAIVLVFLVFGAVGVYPILAARVGISIKEELAAQRRVRAAINAGFSRVFRTLVDTHVSALISAGFLFQFGTGPIRGFAVTLFFGLLSNLFTSIFVSKTLFEIVLSQRRQVATLSI